MGGLQNPVVKRPLDESGSRWKAKAQQRPTHGARGGLLATAGRGREPPAPGESSPCPQQPAKLVHRSQDSLLGVT